MHRKLYTAYDAAFTAKIDAWQPYHRGFLSTFGQEDFARLNSRDRLFDADNRKIVSLAFENRFAPLGGLAAVMRFLPGYLKKAGEDVILLTPLYVNIPRVMEAIDTGALELVIPEQKFQSSSYRGTLRCYINADAPVTAYYIGIDGRFTASANPYAYDNPDDLLDDSLAFCAAVPVVMNKLGFVKDILFHAHDWETAPVALTSKLAVLDGVLESARTVLTLHNSFDSGIGATRKKLFYGVGTSARDTGVKGADRGIKIVGDTILQAAIPLLNGPLTTVSTPFANELRDDPLQRTVFTKHLQDVFDVNPPAGIENGMFGKPYLRYTYAALSWARQGNYSKLLEQKARFRARMLEVVGLMQGRDDVIGGLKEVCADGGIDNGGDDLGGSGGRLQPPAAADRPIFFMSGRLDLMQKGFDVIFQAIRKLSAGRAGLIFCPSSADKAKHSRELAFFRGIADELPGDVVIWPFRISAEDYASVVLGSSFLLMPSFYEPFGAATEGFMHGAPVIARATGGLMVQVGDATGILYREDAGEGWKEILDSPVADRIRIPLYRSMVSAAHAALSAAADVFADRDAYGRMIISGIDSLKSFSWDSAVDKYRRVYDVASRRGFFDD
jgi:glycogen synthase